MGTQMPEEAEPVAWGQERRQKTCKDLPASMNDIPDSLGPAKSTVEPRDDGRGQDLYDSGG